MFCLFVFAWPTWVYYANKEQKCHFCRMFCTRDIVRYYFRLYILKWRFNINNLVLNIRLYNQVNFLTSVADELIVARGQDIGKGGALRVGRKVGDTTCGSGSDSVCVCYVYVLFVFVLCTRCYQSIHSRQKFQLAY